MERKNIKVLLGANKNQELVLENFLYIILNTGAKKMGIIQMKQ